jgi:CRP/FNR family transcriptional regulator
MHFKQMNGRLADTLLYLGGERFKDFEVFGNLTRKDIADFTGISTESTVKLLKQYEKDGIIALEDKDIRILNHGLLVEISKRG